MNEHTPTPWKLQRLPSTGKAVVEYKNPHGEASGYMARIRSKATNNLDLSLDFGYGAKTDEANAEHIVACVNACARVGGPQNVAELVEICRQTGQMLALYARQLVATKNDEEQSEVHNALGADMLIIYVRLNSILAKCEVVPEARSEDDD